jgi:hypothetical protein
MSPGTTPSTNITSPSEVLPTALPLSAIPVMSKLETDFFFLAKMI